MAISTGITLNKNSIISFYEANKSKVIDYQQALNFFGNNSLKIIQDNINIPSDKNILLAIINNIPKYNHTELTECLKTLYLTSNTFGKPIDMIEYYFEDLIIYPSQSLNILFSKKFKDFPSLFEMHQILNNISILEYIVYRLNFNEFFPV